MQDHACSAILSNVRRSSKIATEPISRTEPAAALLGDLEILFGEAKRRRHARDLGKHRGGVSIQ